MSSDRLERRTRQDTRPTPSTGRRIRRNAGPVCQALCPEMRMRLWYERIAAASTGRTRTKPPLKSASCRRSDTLLRLAEWRGRTTLIVLFMEFVPHTMGHPHPTAPLPIESDRSDDVAVEARTRLLVRVGIGAAALLAGVAFCGALLLWWRHGTTVFFDTLSAGFAGCL